MLSGVPGDVITHLANDGRGWEPHITKLITTLVEPGTTCIDVGANIGVHTLAMSAAVGEFGSVIAIEPQPVALSHLAKNISGCTNVTVVPAIAGRDTSVKMRMCAPVVGNMGATSVDFHNKYGHGEPVEVVKIDDLPVRGKVSFVKIDVQGFEMEVLLGAGGVIRQHRPVLLVEIEEKYLAMAGCSSAAVMRWILGQGYVLYRIRARDPRLTFFADHLCVPIELDACRSWGDLTGFPCDRLEGHGDVLCTFSSKVQHAYTTASIRPDRSIAVHAACHNAQQLLPLFVAYYKAMFPGVKIYVHDACSTDLSVDVARTLGCSVDQSNTLSWDLDSESSTWVLLCDVHDFVQLSPGFFSGAGDACLAPVSYRMVGVDGKRAWPVSAGTGFRDDSCSDCVLFRRTATKSVSVTGGCVRLTLYTHEEVLVEPRPDWFCVYNYAHGNAAALAVDAEPVCLQGVADSCSVLPKPSFTRDWTESTQRVLQKIRDGTLAVPRVGVVVEIGCFEGRTTLNLAKTFPDASIVCIDPWLDGMYSPLVPVDFTGQFARFLRNTALVANQIDARRGTSAIALKDFSDGDHVRFAYIDGDHSADAVFNDAEMLWPHIVDGGLVLFDDYEWRGSGGLPDTECPKLGIDRWLALHKDDATVLHVGWQVLVRKLERDGSVRAELPTSNAPATTCAASEVTPAPALAIHVMCFNEEALLPLFVGYYRARFSDAHIYVHDNESTDGSACVAAGLGCVVVPLHTGGLFNEFKLTERRNECWHAEYDTSHSPWVLVCDMDEFLTLTPDMLTAASKDGHVCLKAKGFEMVGTDTEHAWPPIITNGYAASCESKALVFRRDIGRHLRLGLGSHHTHITSADTCGPTPYSNLALLHYHYLSAPYVLKRHTARRVRRDKVMSSGIAYQYAGTVSLEAAAETMAKHRSKATHIPQAVGVFDGVPASALVCPAEHIA